MDKAYSLLEIKEYDDEQRILRGLATTPTPDRVGDIVEPFGVKSEPSIPLFLYHDNKQVVGTVSLGSATSSGIPFVATIPKIAEAGRLKDRVDEAWQMVKYKLITGVSIGFKPVRDKIEQLKGGGLRFLESHVFELSLVPLPANASARISTVKSLDHDLLAASGKEKVAVVRLGKSPGASGNHQYIPKGIEMSKTTAETIAGFESKRAAIVGSMTTIMEKSAEEGATLDDEQTKQYDDAATELETIDEHLKRLRKHEQIMLTKATVITSDGSNTQEKGSNLRGGIITVRDNLPPGTRFARGVMALANGRGSIADSVEYAKRWSDTPDVVEFVKAASSPGTTTHATWAGPLVNPTILSEFIELLRPVTILGRIPGIRRVPPNTKMAVITGGSLIGWVGQNGVKPVGQMAFDTKTLGEHKVAGIIVLTEELIRNSAPSAEQTVRDDLVAQCAQFLDQQFIDPAVAAVANVSPASITNGTTAITASGVDTAALNYDFDQLLATVEDSEMDTGSIVLITRPSLATRIGRLRNAMGQFDFPGLTRSGGELMGYPVVTSGSVPAGVVVMAVASEIMLADEGQVRLDASREATLEMNTAPTGAAAPTFNLWQRNCVGIRAERFITWDKRRANTVAYISGAAYAPEAPAP